jgi:hypothetical protein
MYKVIATNGEVYGPVSVPTMPVFGPDGNLYPSDERSVSIMFAKPMLARLFHRFCVAAALLSLFTAPVQAQIMISDLFNTGVNSSGMPLPTGGVLDTHYTNGASAPTYTFDYGTYFQYSDADYLSINPTGGNGTYTVIFNTTFSLPADAILSSVSIRGNWSMDNVGDNILINGHSTGIDVSSSEGFQAPHAFALPTGYYSTGLNTLGFQFTNIGFVGALAVDFTAKSYSTAAATTPEPGTMALFASLGLTGVAFLRRKRIR